MNPSVMLDTARSVPTPEGIELSLRLAGPVSRALAWLIDFLLRLIVLGALSMTAGAFSKLGVALLLLVWFALEWVYPVVFEVWFGGATPGKRSLGLLVLHDDGTPVRLPASITRNLLRAIDFFPALYGVGLLAMLLNADFKRLGDIAAGTVVVYREPAARHAAVPDSQPMPPPLALTLAERRTVLDFATRTASLSPERAQELALLVPQVTGTQDGALAVKRLHAIASFLIGRQP
jgi:uncharacterized RDD family membrane protein YckC